MITILFNYGEKGTNSHLQVTIVRKLLTRIKLIEEIQKSLNANYFLESVQISV